MGDDANNPRYLRTIPRVGYTFVAGVDELLEPQNRAEGAAIPFGDGNLPADQSSHHFQIEEEERSIRASPTRGAPRTSVRGTWVRRRVIGAVVVLGIAAAAISVFMRWQDSPSALGFRERDWVLISDLENLTSERGLEVAIRVALEQELSLSRYLNYVPPGRVVDTLQLMRLDVGTKLTEDLAREICLRDGGIRALITGSVQQSGHSFQTALKLIDPSTGGAVRILIEEAEDRDHVLASVGRLARRLRETLGESIESIASSQRELERLPRPLFLPWKPIPEVNACSKGPRSNRPPRCSTERSSSIPTSPPRFG